MRMVLRKNIKDEFLDSLIMLKFLEQLNILQSKMSSNTTFLITGASRGTFILKTLKIL